MKIPRPLQNLIQNFERLPGIGPKTAQRLVFYLLHFPQEELERFGSNLVKLKTETKICSICKNVGAVDPCEICQDDSRENSTIAVVASPLDVYALERANFNGVFHVLHGLIDPLNNIGPEEIFIESLLKRVATEQKPLELIIATNSSMEGESTAMYIAKQLAERGFDERDVRITRLARGIPVGGDVEYTDATTLSRALEGRHTFTY